LTEINIAVTQFLTFITAEAVDNVYFHRTGNIESRDVMAALFNLGYVNYARIVSNQIAVMNQQKLEAAAKKLVQKSNSSIANASDNGYDQASGQDSNNSSEAMQTDDNASASSSNSEVSNEVPKVTDESTENNGSAINAESDSHSITSSVPS
jgi:hypothetical protein